MVVVWDMRHWVGVAVEGSEIRQCAAPPDCAKAVIAVEKSSPPKKRTRDYRATAPQGKNVFTEKSGQYALLRQRVLGRG